MSKVGFIFSAIGAAVGLGNIWRFPENMIKNGGFAFLLPYLFAIFVLGLPLLIVEINLGNMWRKTPVGFYDKYLGKHGKFFGWVQTTTQLLIGTYYAIIISWTIISGIEIFDFKGGEDFFNQNILGTETWNWKIALISILVLGLCWFTIRFAFGKGIEIANKIMMPGLFLLILGFIFYSTSLEGSTQGLEHVFLPKWEKLKQIDTWGKAFSQAFFSLSLVVATMIVYSSKGPKNEDNVNRSLIVMAGDTLVALFSCIIVASIIGHSAHLKGIENVSDYIKTDVVDVNSTSGIVFAIFPNIFAQINKIIPIFGSMIGMLFYTALFFAAFSSLIGLVEPTAATLNEEYKWKRKNAATFAILVQFIFGIFYWFPANIATLGIVDGIFVGNLLLISAFIEYAMLIRKQHFINEIINFNNKNSFFKLKKWFYGILIFGFIAVNISIILTIIDPIINGGSSYQNDAKDWGFASLSFFIPFLIMTFGFGYLETWKKYYYKIKNTIFKKVKK